MAGEFENYRPPSALVAPDGSVEIWDAEARDYTQHYPAEKPRTPDQWNTGGDNELFDPSRDTERPNNPIVNAFDLDPHEEDSSPKFGSLFDHLGGPGQGALNDDGDAEQNFRQRWEPGVMRDVADVSCPRCGKPTVDTECPNCGYKRGDDTWRTQDKTPDPGPFNQNVPMRDMHQYDDMVPWGPGATSHYVRQPTATESSEMTDTYDPIARLTIGRDNDPILNDCPECGNPMVKRASEGFEFCPDCGHKNKVMDTTVASFTKEAPGKEHMKGVSPKRNRQYEHIKEQLEGSGKGEAEAKEEAARTVNKQRAEHGETKEGKDDHWIEKAVKKPGQLHKDLGVPEDEDIPEDKLEGALHSDSKKERERAQFAENVKKGGFGDDLSQLGGDVGGVAGDLVKGQPQNLPGDIGGVAGDVGGDLKDTGGYVAAHPVQAATYAGMAALPFVLPGAGEAIDAAAAPALLGEGGAAVTDAAAGAGEGAAEDAAAGGGMNVYDGQGGGPLDWKPSLSRGLGRYQNVWNKAGLPGWSKGMPYPSGGGPILDTAAPAGGVPASAAPAPGRLGGMMGTAKAAGSMYAGQRALNALTGGSSTSTDPNAEMQYTPWENQSSVRTSGLELTRDEVAERRAWSQNYDLFTHLAADDDGSSDLSVRDDGDNITDPKTQGSQEETGDSLDELMKSIGDDGSANIHAYDDKQNDAIHHFNQNLPTIIAFMLSDESGKGHPIIDSVDNMLKEAFPDYNSGDDSDSHDDSHDDSVPPEHVKSEAPHHEDEEKKAASVRRSVQLTQNPSPVPSPAQVAPGAGMQPQTQQSTAPCALCGGPHPTDQHPSAVTPPAQGGQFGTTMGKVSWLEAVAARKPKMCPFHGDLVDYSLTAGDPVSARTAVRPSDYGAAYCKSGQFEGKCNFKPGMVTQAYWDERDEKSQQRREQIQETPEAGFPGAEVEMPVQAEPEVEEGYVPEQRHDVPPAQETAVGFGTMNNPDNALQMAAKILREANVVPSGYHFDLAIQKTADIHSLGLTEGGRYKMHSNKYDVPDDVTVTKIKPTSIQVVYHFPGGMDSAPQELTEEQLTDQGIHTFEPMQEHHTDEGTFSEELDNRAQQPDTAPDAGEVTDLSQTHGAADPIEAEFDGDLEGGEAEGMQLAAGFREVDGGFFVDQDDNPVDYETYSSMRRQTTPAELQWLWDDVHKQNQLSAREKEMQAVLAGRQFSYREQADLIQEPGTARNGDKLDLSGTHYVDEGYGTDAVPDEHLWLGI